MAAERTLERRFGPVTGACVVIANMIGVGVFTTTGYLLHDLGSPLVVLTGWLVGAVAALCGALCYAELGAALPENGGEYKLLSRIMHPYVGFLAAWTSLVVGFAAPTAMMGLAFGSYLQTLLVEDGSPAALVVRKVAAVAVIGLLAVVHSVHVGLGGKLHSLLTVLKVSLLFAFIGCGLMAMQPGRLVEGAAASDALTLFSAPFAVGLYYIAFTYAGWNSAAYLAGEIRDPEKNVPRALFAGTGLVCLIYLAFNVVLLASGPSEAIAASGDRVALVAAKGLFGERWGGLVAVIVAVGLVSTVSSQLLAGPRVSEAVGRDYPRLAWLSTRRAAGGPVYATLLQAGLAIGLALASGFETLLTYVGFLLSLFAALTVLGVVLLRRNEPGLARPYRVWAYPAPVVVVVALEGWMLVQAIRSRPEIVVAGLATLAVGSVLYVVVGRRAV